VPATPTSRELAHLASNSWLPGSCRWYPRRRGPTSYRDGRAGTDAAVPIPGPKEETMADLTTLEEKLAEATGRAAAPDQDPDEE
jgi:hypothetical protein